MYEALIPFCRTPEEIETIQAVVSNGTQAKAAQALGQNIRTVKRKLANVKKRAAKQGYSPDHGMVHTVPEGYFVKGVSTLYGDDGEIKAQWVKSNADMERLRLACDEALEAFLETLPRAKPVNPPKTVKTDLLNQYTITDFHLGALAWDEECGEDWDTDIAETLLIDWFYEAINRSPNAEIGLLAQIGDFLHWDGLEAVTPASRHLLDADTRFQRVVRVAIRVLRQIITLLLKKHASVHIIMADANHDPASAVWLREWLSAHYENEPRVTVDRSADTYYCYEFGNVSLFFHHGHKRRPENVDDVFAAKFREVFGRTKYSYAHMGHMHHEKALETNLMLVRQHRTLAAKDAYASRGGWMAGRDARVITYHKNYGYAGEVVVTPEMLK